MSACVVAVTRCSTSSKSHCCGAPLLWQCGDDVSAPQQEKLLERLEHKIHRTVTADGFDIERAAADVGTLNKVTEMFGPAGAYIFFAEEDVRLPQPGSEVRRSAPDPDPDASASRLVVGPKSDGLVRIENAYVRANTGRSSSSRVRAATGRSTRRRATRTLSDSCSGAGRSPCPAPDSRCGARDGTTWQAGMRLAIPSAGFRSW